MSITYNATFLESMKYNAQDLDTVTYNAVDVFTKNTSVVILESVTFQTDSSVVPPPYDQNGYNFDADAPLKTKSHYIDLGDVTNYSSLEFRWNNQGSINTYGSINGYVGLANDYYAIPDEPKLLFTDNNKSGVFTLDLSNVSGHKWLCLELTAKSASNYKGYISLAKMTVMNVTVYQTGHTPPTPEDYVILLDKARIEAYSNEQDELEQKQYNLSVPDVTPYSKITFQWDNTNTTAPWGYVVGLWASSSDGIEKQLYEGTDKRSGEETLDVTNLTGSLTITFTVKARTDSENKSWIAWSVLNISNVRIYK